MYRILKDGGYIYIMQYAEIRANWLPRPKAQPPKPSATANLATDNNNVGRKQQKRSLYTPNVIKSAMSEITTAYNRFLGILTLLSGQLYHLKTRTLAAAGCNFQNKRQKSAAYRNISGRGQK